jgi:hypothetical protein
MLSLVCDLMLKWCKEGSRCNRRQRETNRRARSDGAKLQDELELISDVGAISLLSSVDVTKVQAYILSPNLYINRSISKMHHK